MINDPVISLQNSSDPCGTNQNLLMGMANLSFGPSRTLPACLN